MQTKAVRGRMRSVYAQAARDDHILRAGLIPCSARRPSADVRQFNSLAGPTPPRDGSAAGSEAGSRDSDLAVRPGDHIRVVHTRVGEHAPTDQLVLDGEGERLAQ